MKMRKNLILAASAILAATLFCPPANARSDLECGGTLGGCADCKYKRKVECWGGMPGAPPAGAIYKCGQVSVAARRIWNDLPVPVTQCYPSACWKGYEHYWPLYQNMCATLYKDCCERTESGKCSVFFKHHLDGSKFGYPEGYRPPGQ